MFFNETWVARGRSLLKEAHRREDYGEGDWADDMAMVVYYTEGLKPSITLSIQLIEFS